MGRVKGSKNKPKTIDEVREKVSTEMKKETAPNKMKTEKSPQEEKEEPTQKKVIEQMAPKVQVPVRGDKTELECKGVTPRQEAPRIPECLVDGGMLYRWLNDLRKTYLEEKVDKGAVKALNEMMDYIMRMEKKQRE
jgi:hypothetical protein